MTGREFGFSVLCKGRRLCEVGTHVCVCSSSLHPSTVNSTSLFKTSVFPTVPHRDMYTYARTLGAVQNLFCFPSTWQLKKNCKEGSSTHFKCKVSFVIKMDDVGSSELLWCTYLQLKVELIWLILTWMWNFDPHNSISNQFLIFALFKYRAL